MPDRAVTPRTLLATAVVGLAAVLLATAVASAAAAPDDSGAVTVGPLVAGTSSYVDGTYAWTDYVYDDRGPGSSASYPEGPGNLADLVQLQLSHDRGEWVIRAVLQTLLPELIDAPLLGVGFDVDGSPATGAPAAPGSWSPAEPLGLEVMVLIATGRAEVLRWDGQGWASEATLPATVDAASNVLETRIPQQRLRLGPQARLVGALGLGLDGHSWVDGDGPVFDLAFVGDEPPAGWQDRTQAAVLDGDQPGGVASVDLNRVRSGHTELATAADPGFHTLLYRSALELGEGIRSGALSLPGGQQVPLGDLYAGPYQPYLVWLPDALPEHPPVVVSLHGFGGTHTSNASSFGAGAFAPDAVVVMPLGRGEMSFYFGEAEQDVLDVVDDALDRYAADADRVVLSGISMGGFGSFRLGVRYPDRWSVAVPFIGTGLGAQQQFRPIPPEVIDAVFPPDRFPSGNNELLENLRNLPVRMVNGQIDPIVTDAYAEQDVLRLRELGYDHRSWVLARRHHEVVPALANCVLVEATKAERARDPARVTYAVRPAIHMTDPDTGLDLRYDAAYWISEIVAADDVGSGKATVDVVSLARANRDPTASDVVDAGENLTSGRDLCGENPDVQTGDVWRLTGIELTAGDHERANALTADLVDVTALALDVTRMDLAVDETLTLEVDSVEEARLHLDGPWPGAVSVTRDGEPSGTIEPDAGRLTVSLVSGRQTVELAPAEAPAGGSVAAARGRDPLPATGGGAGIVGLAALALLGLLRHLAAKDDVRS